MKISVQTVTQVLLFNIIFSICTLAVSNHSILIVVSFDGFKNSYFDEGRTPFMSKIRLKGSWVDYLDNIFPTKTFPIHHTISTGLYPGVHGVIGNSIFDAKTNRTIGVDDADFYHFNKNITPVWILNEKIDKSRYSGCMMWPGGSDEYQGLKPTHLQTYNVSIPWRDRIDKVISWIKDPSKPANLVMVYFNEPDTSAHIYGTDSPIVERLIKQLDDTAHYLHDKLMQEGLDKVVNVIHLSDHGMRNFKYSEIIRFGFDDFTTADSSATLHIIPKPGGEDDLFRRLMNVSMAVGGFKVYRKQDLPSRWFFGNNSRLPPILAVSEGNLALQDMIKIVQRYNISFNNDSKFGIHGYDNTDPEMRPFFFAVGPAIKQHYKAQPFSTIDLFELFCAILSLESPPNNGSFQRIQHVLADCRGTPALLMIELAILFGLLLACLYLLLCSLYGSQLKTTLQSSTSLKNSGRPAETQYLLLDPEYV